MQISDSFERDAALFIKAHRQPHNVSIGFDKETGKERTVRINGFTAPDPRTLPPTVAALYKQKVGRFLEMMENATHSRMNGLLAYEALYTVDRQIAETIWPQMSLIRLLKEAGCTSVAQFSKDPLKEYMVTTKGWPVVSRTFDTVPIIMAESTSQFHNPIGWAHGYQFNWLAKRREAGNLWDNYAICRRECAMKFAQFGERIQGLGTSGYHVYDESGAAPATAVTGIYNDAKIAAASMTLGAGAGADNDVTADMDIPFTIMAYRNKLGPKLLQPGKTVIISTAGVFDEIIRHRHTYTNTTDMKVVLEYQAAGLFDEWWVTPAITAKAHPTYQEQAMMMIRLGPATYMRQLLIPQQILPRFDKSFAEDEKAIMICDQASGYRLYDTTWNGFPAVTASGAITASTAGHTQPGRVL